MREDKAMHEAELVFHAHLTCRPTVSSAGALYGLLIAADDGQRARNGDRRIDWQRVHSALREKIGSEDDYAWIRKLDRIKAAGWATRDAIAREIEGQNE